MKNKLLLCTICCFALLFTGCSNKKNQTETNTINSNPNIQNNQTMKSDNTLNIKQSNNKLEALNINNNDVLPNLKNAYTPIANTIFGKDVKTNFISAKQINLDRNDVLAIIVENIYADNISNRRLLFARLDGQDIKLLHTKLKDTNIPEGLPANKFIDVFDEDKFTVEYYSQDFKSDATNYKLEADVKNDLVELEYDDFPKPKHDLDYIENNFFYYVLLQSQKDYLSDNLPIYELVNPEHRVFDMGEKPGPNVYKFNKFEILSIFNLFGDDIEDIEDIINYFNKPKKDTNYNFISVDDTLSDKTKDQISEYFSPNWNEFKILHFTKDDSFLIHVSDEVGAAFSVPPTPRDQWIVNDDSVKINYSNGYKNREIKLKLNDKGYIFNKARNPYYVD